MASTTNAAEIEPSAPIAIRMSSSTTPRAPPAARMRSASAAVIGT
jgi:hypothetical protein